jgi:hypothetical protein
MNWAFHYVNINSTFMITCWHLWAWRNKTAFEEGFQRPTNPSNVIQSFGRATETSSFNQQ